MTTAVAATTEAVSRKFTRDLLFSHLPLPFLKFRAYLWLAVLTRFLGVQGFGEWSMIMTTLTLATALVAMNLGSSLMRFLVGERQEEEVSRAWSTVMCNVLVNWLLISTILVICWGWFERVAFHGKTSTNGWWISGALLADVIHEVARNVLRARRRNKQWAILTLARLLVETVALMAVAVYFRTVFSLVLTYTVAGLLFAVADVTYLCLWCRVRALKPDGQVLRRYSAFGLALMPGAIAYMLCIQGDRYLISSLAGLYQVGIYAAEVTISGLVFFLVGPINDVLFPELSQLYDEGNWTVFYDRLAAINKIVLSVSIAAASLLIAFPSDALRLIASAKFADYTTPLRLLAIQGIFMGLLQLQIVVLNVKLKVWHSSAVWASYAAIVLSFDLILIPRFGSTGAAGAQVLASGACFATLLRMNRDIVRKTFPIKWLLQIGVAALGVFLVRSAFSHPAADTRESMLRLTIALIAFVPGLLLTRFTTVNQLRGLAIMLVHRQ